MTDRPLRTCSKCGHGTTEAGDRCPAPRCGAVLPGNGLAVTHGMDRALERQPEAVAEIEARAARVFSDLGGDPSYVMASQVRDYIRLELMVESGFAHLAGLADDADSGLVVTGKGRTRALADKLVAHLQAKHRIAIALGLRRVERDMGSLESYAAALGKASDGRG